MSKQSIQPTKKLNQNTKSKIRAGMTNRMGTKTRKYGGTYGNTTTSKSGSKEQEGWVIDEYGNEMNVKPDSLLKRYGGGGRDKHADDKTEQTEMDSRQLNNDSESVPLQKRNEDKQQVADKIKSGMESANGMQTSQSMLSSMLEGSEDDESKQASKNKKKGKEVVKDLSEIEGK